MIFNILLITSESFNICERNSTYIAFENDTSLLFDQINNLYNLKEEEKYINLEKKINFFVFITKKKDLNYINNCNKKIYNFIYPYIYKILNSEYKTIISKALIFFSENSKLQFLESYEMNNSSVSGRIIFFDRSYKIKRNFKYHKIVKNIICKFKINIEFFDKFLRRYCRNEENYILFYYLLTEITIENNLIIKKNEINKNFKKLTNYFNLLLCNFNDGPIDFNSIIDLKYKIFIIDIIKKYLGIAFNISPKTFSFTINKKTGDFSILKIEKTIEIEDFREISDNLEIGSNILINLIKNKIKDENYQILQDDNYKIIKNFTLGDENKSFLVLETNKTSFKESLNLFTAEEITDILIIFGKNEYKIEKDTKNKIYKITSEILNEMVEESIQ